MRLIYFIWSLIERFGTNFVSLAGNIILSYLLMPEDFGLVAMLGVFTSMIFVFIDCGLSDGLLTLGTPHRRDFNTVFFFNIAVGITIAVVYCAISPFVARYLGNPALQPMLCVLGSGAIFSGLSLSQMTRLRVEHRFKQLALFNVLSITLALAIAIVMALNGARYWALVELQVGFVAFFWLLLALFTRWDLRLEFDVRRFKSLWAFGVNLLMSTIIGQVAQNIFSFVIGKHINPTHAGYMGQAQKLQQTPTNSLESAISTTAYVLIAQQESAEQKRAAFFEMFGVVTYINSAFCFFMLALSFPLIDFIFPAKWLPAIPYFRLMLCWALVYPVCNFMMIIFKIFSRTSVIRNVYIIEKALVVVSAFVLYPYGVKAMILAAVALSLMSFLLVSHFASRVTGERALRYVQIYVTHLAMLAVVAGCAYGVTLLSQPCGSLVAILAGGATFVACLAVVTRVLRRGYYDYVVAHLVALKAKHGAEHVTSGE